MIKHIVMFKLKPTQTIFEKEKVAEKVKLNFESLKAKIKEIHSYTVGINISKSPSAFDVVVDSTFKSEEDLKTYSKHPEHIKAVEFNSKFSSEKVVVDYLI
ncbi:MAG: Dabb family protein [Chlorobi bacterium]|nr:Dabb family protein [Chlorobiota bacterium]